MSSSKISLLIKESYTEESSFVALLPMIRAGKVSEKNLADFLEMCHHHLRKPVKETLSKRSNGAQWIIWALLGLSMTSAGMIPEKGALAQKFVDGWRDISRWSKTIVAEHPFFGHFDSFCGTIGPIFNMICLIAEPLLAPVDIYDLAIDLWKGKDTAGVNVHTEAPLFLCTPPESTWHVNRLLQRTGYDPMQVMDMITERMKSDIGPPNGPAPEKIFASVNLLSKLVQSKNETMSMAVLCSEAPDTISSNLTRLLDHKDESLLYQDTIISSIGFLRGYTQANQDNVAEVLNFGHLYNILVTASMRSVDGAEEGATSCLESLILSLAYDHVIMSVSDGLGEILRDKHSIAKLLGKTSPNFRRLWGTFEELLLEQSILEHLFEKGYSRERGACANRICHKLAERRDFKKCAGCGFTLYCSKECQSQDWKRHRRNCKGISKEYEKDYNHCTNSFPRKAATTQIIRHWSEITLMAKREGIPDGRIGVRVDYSEYPYRIGVFNYEGFVLANPLLSAQDHPYHSMVAAEALERTEQGHRCVMLVVIHSDDREFPSLGYLDEEPSASLEKLLEGASIGYPGVQLHYTDENRRPISPRKDDVLGKAVRLSRTQLQKSPDKFWGEENLFDIVEKVLKADSSKETPAK